MTTAIIAAAVLPQREESIAALTAWAWASRGADPTPAWDVVTRVYGVAAYDSAAARALGINGYLAALSDPDAGPSLGLAAGTSPLLVQDQLTESAMDVLTEQFGLGIDINPNQVPNLAALTAAVAEGNQHDTYRILRADGDPARYTAARRALIEHPAGTHRDLADAWNAVGHRVDAYRALLPGMTRRGWWVPCPHCRWPMTFTDNGIECLLERDRNGGARFRVTWSREGQPSLVTLSAPRMRHPMVKEPSRVAPLRADDVSAVSYGVWRYIVIPGVVELTLAEHLESLPGVVVELWPDLDRYDLDIRAGDVRWCVDVKDWRSPARLAADLSRNPPALPSPHQNTRPRIVVPHNKRNQIPTLRQAVPSGVKVVTDQQLLAEINKAVRL